ncbi:MAG: radical SAM protein [Candidatus Omnitrophica bacterium]|nr:radical SAM protein [Candidatus Omnitrophota bacterium]
MAKVALIQNIMVENMGYMYISAVLKEAGHQVEFFYCDHFSQKKILQKLNKFGPDLVGFSVLRANRNYFLELAQTIKESIETRTIFGNIDAILNPEIIDHPGVDIVCLCEGEYVMRELCQCLDRKESYCQIQGLWVKTAQGIQKNPMPESLVDLDRLPFHDRHLYDNYVSFRRSSYLRVSTGRGCPGSCSFCNNLSLRKYFGGSRYLRKQSPKRAIEEIEYQISQRKRVKFIFFTDEVFWLDRKWLYEFLDLYRLRIKIPFSANYNFLSDLDEEDIKLLSESYINNFIFAVESGDESQRINLLQKRVTDEKILRIAQWLKKYKIKYVSSVMFGLPKDSVKDHIDRMNFYKKLNPSYLWSAFFQPYPGTQLAELPDVKCAFFTDREFSPTVHHSLCVASEDSLQISNLKKVYFLCVKFPIFSNFLVWLTKFRIPFLFDLLFMIHFSYYMFAFERISIFHFFMHLKAFCFNPILNKFKAKGN